MAIGTILLLLFPSSPSVLCITPGGHVAVEEMGSACCASSGGAFVIRKAADDDSLAGMACHNCTDVFMTPNVRGAVLSASPSMAPRQMAQTVAAYDCQPDGLFFENGAGVNGEINALVGVPSSLPLLC